MAYSKSLGFGSGFVFMTPVGASDNTPVRLGTMQNVSLDITFDEKPLWGQNQFAEAVARGKAKFTCKAAFAQIETRAIAEVFLQGTPTSGQNIIYDLEAHTVSGAAATVTNTTGGITDLGVFYATTGQPFKSGNVAATGNYTVNLGTGVYSFNAGDNGAAILISYTNISAGSGFITTITNQAMGSYIPFQVDLYQINPENVPNTQWGARLYKCASHKLTMNTKQDDWLIPDIDFSVYANPAGKVMDFNVPV